MSSNGIEIERKFIIHPRVLAQLAASPYDRHVYTNYYIVVGDTELRVHQRKYGQWVMTIKQGHGHVRSEVEVVLGDDEAQNLLALPNWSVTKTRIWLGKGWSVDVYSAPYVGIVTAEIETPAVDTAIELPEVLRNAGAKEVTGTKLLANQRMAQLSKNESNYRQIFTFVESALLMNDQAITTFFHSR